MKLCSIYLSSILVFFLTISSVAAFELNGCWKNDGMADPFSTLCFTKDKFKFGTGKGSFSAKYSYIDDIILVHYMSSILRIKGEKDNLILVTYPDPMIPQNIKYYKLPQEEADSILNKKN